MSPSVPERAQVDVAHERANEILGSYRPSHIPADRNAAARDRWPIAFD
ncbi:MAG: hypothetical protein P8J50_09195 [Acidimicrobiales bacterium]|jgi:hypothetical protein|nr:hypothetical protein [Acidimicrobiales bacterium]